MIILASAVIISLSNTNIFNKAEEAVKANDLKTAQQIVALVYADWYLDNMPIKDETTALQDLKYAVDSELIKNGIQPSDYTINITTSGVDVSEITLGDLVASAEDYVKTVNYEANGVKDWKVFYETETMYI